MLPCAACLTGRFLCAWAATSASRLGCTYMPLPADIMFCVPNTSFAPHLCLRLAATHGCKQMAALSAIAQSESWLCCSFGRMILVWLNYSRLR